MDEAGNASNPEQSAQCLQSIARRGDCHQPVVCAGVSSSASLPRVNNASGGMLEVKASAPFADQD